MPSAAANAAEAHKLSREPLDRLGRRHQVAAAVGPALDLDLALGAPLGSDQHLPGHSDEIGGGEFRAWTLVAVVVEHVDALGRERTIELFTGGVGVGATLLEVEDHDLEGRDRLRPLDAGV